MNTKKTVLIPIIALIFIAVALSAVTAGVLISQQNIPANGTVGSITGTINIAVCRDPQTTSNCSNIDWGNLTPGQNTTRTIYVKNTGNISETLTLTTVNWNPSIASSSLLLVWDKEGASLAAGETTPATLTLSVAANTGNLFNFSCNIVASGTA